MDWMNYHHLYYFWVIATEGSVTVASGKLRLSQSTLSAQLKQLEDYLGEPLFHRESRKLVLTEVGRMVLDYASHIFSLGQEMHDLIRHRTVTKKRQILRIGALSSLSKNLQFEFIQPYIGNPEIRLIVVEGNLNELTKKLENFDLDLVISNMPVRTDEKNSLYNHRLGSIPVCLVGTPSFKKFSKDFPRSLSTVPLFVPNYQSRVRSEFELYLHQNNIEPEIQAEVEDMALLRILALSGKGLSVVPEIVVSGELKTKKLVVVHRFQEVTEVFFALVPRRQKPNHAVRELIEKFSLKLKKEF